jgi:hypothetical protein
MTIGRRLCLCGLLLYGSASFAQQATPDPFDIRSHIPASTRIGIVNADGSVTYPPTDEEKSAAHDVRSNAEVVAGAFLVVVSGYFYFKRRGSEAPVPE